MSIRDSTSPPKTPPKGLSGVSRPAARVIEVVIGRPMCPHHCKACENER